jgi:hypothetical protein
MRKPLVPEDLHLPFARDAAVATFTRACICVGLNKLDRRPVSEHIKRWRDDQLELVVRAATTPTAIATAGPLATAAHAFLSALVPVSAGIDLLGRGLGLQFAGAASIIVPSIAVPVADFVAELSGFPVQQATTGPGTTLTPHKLGVIATLTSEMMRSSSAEQLVRQVLVEACGPAIDRVLFSSTAAAPDRPAGLLHNITALTPAAAGEKAQAVVDDLQSLAIAVAPVAGNGNIVLVASPDSAVALVLRLPQSVTWPVLTSASLAARTVIAVAANALVNVVEGGPQIDAATQTAVHEETAPLPIVSPTGTVAYPVRSLYQTDAVALRMRWPLTWSLRAPNAIAYMTAVNW